MRDLNAVCGMNTQLYSGKKPHPLFGMHMINDTVMTRIKGQQVCYSGKKTSCLFFDDLSVTMRHGLKINSELTLAYDSVNVEV